MKFNLRIKRIGAIIVGKTYNYNLNFLNYNATFALALTLYYIDKGKRLTKTNEDIKYSVQSTKACERFLSSYQLKNHVKC